jgi:ADP-heptose:LPS heptosyltransferase
MVSMDSANGHLAALFGVPVITIWGVTHPFAGFAPYGQPKDNQILANNKEFPLIPTSVYGNKYPKGYENAIGSISPKTIIKRIMELL